MQKEKSQEKGEVEEIAQKVRLIYARRLLVYGKSRVGWLLRKEGRSVVTHFLRETQATIHPRRPSFQRCEMPVPFFSLALRNGIHLT